MRDQSHSPTDQPGDFVFLRLPSVPTTPAILPNLPALEPERFVRSIPARCGRVGLRISPFSAGPVPVAWGLAGCCISACQRGCRSIARFVSRSWTGFVRLSRRNRCRCRVWSFRCIVRLPFGGRRWRECPALASNCPRACCHGS